MTHKRPSKGKRTVTTPSGRYWRHGIDLATRTNYARIALWPILVVCAVFMKATHLEDL
jgi:hypothetical protein